MNLLIEVPFLAVGLMVLSFTLCTSCLKRIKVKA